MRSTAEIIYELVKTLPEDQANLVLVFAEFVSQRTQSSESLDRPSIATYFAILKDSPNFRRCRRDLEGDET
ncbi:hypothetical protein Glo7428_0584 [Gloeocapsa sp. PCC 7428]|nr:hypothetical protein Glo7428_0584 [Gloeocapsa sp. PCC 7428]